MFRTVFAGCVMAASMVPLSGFAGDKDAMVASEGSYELWASTVGDEKGWAVVNTEDDKTVYAEKKGDEVEILTGKKAKETLARLRDAMPGTDVVQLSGNSDIRIETKAGDEEAGDKKVRVLELKSDSGADIDIETLLEEAGVSLNGDLTVDTDDGRKHIVIRTNNEADGVDIDVKTIHLEHEIEAGSGEAKTEIRVIRVPETPATPETPETPETSREVTVVTGDGQTMVVSGKHKMVTSYSADEDGDVSKSFVHMSGISAREAVEFIDDIEELSASEKDTMKAALSI